jgi:hypothetical protein
MIHETYQFPMVTGNDAMMVATAMMVTAYQINPISNRWLMVAVISVHRLMMLGTSSERIRMNAATGTTKDYGE